MRDFLVFLLTLALAVFLAVSLVQHIQAAASIYGSVPLPVAAAAAAVADATPTLSVAEPGSETLLVVEELSGPDQSVDWFHPTGELLAAWHASLDPQQEDILLLRPHAAQPAYRLFFLFTQGSAEFDRAVEMVLWNYQERGVWVEAALALVPEAYNYTAGERTLASLQAAQAAGYDLVYAVGPEATQLVYDNYRAETGLLPVVTLQAKDPVLLGQVADYDSGSGTNIAYTSLNVPLDVQMSYFVQLVPDLHNIMVLYDFGNTSTVKTQVEPLGSYALQHDIELYHLSLFNSRNAEAARAELRSKFPNIMNDINHADPFSNQSLLLVANSSLLVEIFDVVDELAGRIPVVSLLPEVVQEGQVSALLSVGVTLDGNAALAAAYGLRILQEGISPGELPVGVLTPPDVAINFAKARELSLRIPFTLFERATTIYDAQGRLASFNGQAVTNP